MKIKLSLYIFLFYLIAIATVNVSAKAAPKLKDKALGPKSSSSCSEESSKEILCSEEIAELRKQGKEVPGEDDEEEDSDEDYDYSESEE
jgi:hypothetical protein